jgi:1-acyl-sn-glycerol-3-phosphate acyltransferase
MMPALRSLAFNVLAAVWLFGLGLLTLPMLLLPRRWVWVVVRLWARGVLAMLRTIVGLDYTTNGLAPGPQGWPARGAMLLAAKHQSAWDTIVFLVLLDEPAIVLKRELFRIPLYGWFTWKIGMIGIDRAAGARALKDLVARTRPALAAGRPVLIFPQGTRTAPGTHRAYLPGVYALYAATGLPVVPVALDSGRFWGRRSFVKRPGRITVSFLEPIAPGLDRRTFMAELERRIETATTALEAGDKSTHKPVDPGERPAGRGPI